MPDSAAAVDAWSRARAYESYVGRWSRPVAHAFVAWLDPQPGLRWLDVGCGTGALTEAVLLDAAPLSVTGVDVAPTRRQAVRIRARPAAFPPLP